MARAWQSIKTMKRKLRPHVVYLISDNRGLRQTNSRQRISHCSSRLKYSSTTKKRISSIIIFDIFLPLAQIYLTRNADHLAGSTPLWLRLVKPHLQYLLIRLTENPQFELCTEVPASSLLQKVLTRYPPDRHMCPVFPMGRSSVASGPPLD